MVLSREYRICMPLTVEEVKFPLIDIDPFNVISEQC